MKTKNKYLFLKIVITVLVLIIVCLFFIVKNSINKYDLDCIAINDQNGNIAISYFDNDYAVIKVYDKNGSKLFGKKVYNNGGSVHNMFFDENNYLHVILGRIQAEQVYNEIGDKISENVAESSYVDMWDLWNKQGTSYSKKVDSVTYFYDYVNIFELIVNQSDRVFLQFENGETIEIWRSSKKR